MIPEFYNTWRSINDGDKRILFREVAENMGLPAAAIEKDWWVVQTLSLVFSSSIGPHTVFKGGTSLSKAWKLIDRFSEDVDLALDRRFLGIDGVLNPTQVRKLRRKSFAFTSETFYPEMVAAFAGTGLGDVTVQMGEVKDKDQDPLTIVVNYRPLTDTVSYLPPRVLIELGSRSLLEPFTEMPIRSFVGEQYSGRDFADEAINIPCVNPERTFLEKIFLLHEAFLQPAEKVRVDRKSRHLYDLERLMDTAYAAAALSDKELYQTIVEHRRMVTPLRGITYERHTPEHINPLPPDDLAAAWEKDYAEMRESMLYNNPPDFTTLMKRIIELKQRINTLSKRA